MSTATIHNSSKRAVWPRLILPLALILLGILIMVLAPLQVIDSATDPVGPRFLPFLSGSAVTLGGLADLIVQMKTTRTATVEGSDETQSSDDHLDRKALLISYGLILAGIAVWVYTTVLIGYGLSSLILMSLTAVAFGLRRPVQMIILVVVTIGVTYAVFAELLHVQLSLIGW